MFQVNEEFKKKGGSACVGHVLWKMVHLKQIDEKWIVFLPNLKKKCILSFLFFSCVCHHMFTKPNKKNVLPKKKFLEFPPVFLVIFFPLVFFFFRYHKKNIKNEEEEARTKRGSRHGAFSVDSCTQRRPHSDWECAAVDCLVGRSTRQQNSEKLKSELSYRRERKRDTLVWGRRPSPSSFEATHADIRKWICAWMRREKKRINAKGERMRERNVKEYIA